MSKIIIDGHRKSPKQAAEEFAACHFGAYSTWRKIKHFKRVKEGVFTFMLKDSTSIYELRKSLFENKYNIEKIK